MSESIKLTLSVQVTGGPKMVAAKTLEVEAYEKITLEVPNDSIDVQVELQPGGVGEVKLIMITSDTYGDELTYRPDGGTTTIVLDQPHLFIGAGGVGVLGSPETLIFNNDLPDPSSGPFSAKIEMLVGRDASGSVPEDPP
jgi:hypothetical protein